MDVLFAVQSHPKPPSKPEASSHVHSNSEARVSASRLRTKVAFVDFAEVSSGIDRVRYAFDAFVSGAKLVQRPSAYRWSLRSTSSVGTPLASGGVPLARLLRAVRCPSLVLSDILPGHELRRQKLDG